MEFNRRAVDENAWKNMFLNNKFTNVRKRALSAIADQEFLKSVVLKKNPITGVKTDYDNDMRSEAVKTIIDEDFLRQIAKSEPGILGRHPLLLRKMPITPENYMREQIKPYPHSTEFVGARIPGQQVREGEPFKIVNYADDVDIPADVFEAINPHHPGILNRKTIGWIGGSIRKRGPKGKDMYIDEIQSDILQRSFLLRDPVKGVAVNTQELEGLTKKRESVTQNIKTMEEQIAGTEDQQKKQNLLPQVENMRERLKRINEDIKMKKQAIERYENKEFNYLPQYHQYRSPVEQIYRDWSKVLFNDVLHYAKELGITDIYLLSAKFLIEKGSWRSDKVTRKALFEEIYDGLAKKYGMKMDPGGEYWHIKLKSISGRIATMDKYARKLTSDEKVRIVPYVKTFAKVLAKEEGRTELTPKDYSMAFEYYLTRDDEGIPEGETQKDRMNPDYIEDAKAYLAEQGIEVEVPEKVKFQQEENQYNNLIETQKMFEEKREKQEGRTLRQQLDDAIVREDYELAKTLQKEIDQMNKLMTASQRTVGGFRDGDSEGAEVEITGGKYRGQFGTLVVRPPSPTSNQDFSEVYLTPGESMAPGGTSQDIEDGDIVWVPNKFIKKASVKTMTDSKQGEDPITLTASDEEKSKGKYKVVKAGWEEIYFDTREEAEQSLTDRKGYVYMDTAFGGPQKVRIVSSLNGFLKVRMHNGVEYTVKEEDVFENPEIF